VTRRPFPTTSPRAALATGLAAWLITLALPASANPQEEGLPSFNESEACETLVGLRGPLAEAPGILEVDEPIYGPWADFYGRTVGDAWNQRVVFQFPTVTGSPKTFWVHERVLPALQLALQNLQTAAAAGNTYTVRTGDSYSWARYTIPPTRAFSFHAVGAALDINSTTNPYRTDNVLITDMPTWFVDAWRSAGWCWGGNWLSKKDPMHFAWRGPLFTPGYTMPPPQPPLVAAAGFSAEWALDVRLGPSNPARDLVVADIDRDGAPDIVAVTPVAGGQVAITAAPARNDFHWPEAWGMTAEAPTGPSAPLALADLTGDGRPDLVYVLEGPLGMVDLEVFAHTGGEDLPRSNLPTGVPYDPGATYLFDDHERNGTTDLFVVRPGSPATLGVWPGERFTSAAVVANLTVGSDDHAFTLGDRDVDGIPDLFALGMDGYLTVFTGASGYETSLSVATGIDPSLVSVQAGDLDGDGHTDLFFVDPEAHTVVRRGGASTHDPGVWYRIRTHQVTRLAGPDRYATATAVSQAHSPDPDTVDTVFVATGSGFADALAGAAVAGRLGAPLLLVGFDFVPAATAAELTRLSPAKIVVLGGEAVISPEVETTLGTYGSTVRLAGLNRYETAVAISQYGFPEDGSADEVVVASGTGFADALTGGPAAAALNGALLLTEPTRLPDAVRVEIIRLAPSRIIVLGGTGAVSQAVFNELNILAPAIRVSGPDRYATAAALSATAFPNGAEQVYLATGLTFPDALAGGAAAAAQGVPILLVPSGSLPGLVAAEILRLGAYEVILLGGSGAVSATIESAAETLGM